MKNGMEKRKNGSWVVKRAVSHMYGSCSYNVFFACGTASKGNPWDYLRNARDDADGKNPQNMPGVI